MSRVRIRRLVWLLSVPMATGLLGVWLLLRHGAPASRVALMLVALVAMGAVAVALAARGRDLLARRAPVLVGVALALLAATFFADPLDTVHRWIALGPVRMHASSLACPLLLPAAASLVARGRWAWGVVALAVAQAIHAVQPDAGQSTALAFGALTGLALWPAPWRARAAGIAALVVSTVPAWWRPDPLPAVPEVEGIVGLAATQGILVAVVAVTLLAAMPLSLALAARATGDATERATRVALAAYVAGLVVVPMLGNFPVPVLGFGVSPVLGVGICVGFCAALGEG